MFYCRSLLCFTLYCVLFPPVPSIVLTVFLGLISLFMTLAQPLFQISLATGYDDDLSDCENVVFVLCIRECVCVCVYNEIKLYIDVEIKIKWLLEVFTCFVTKLMCFFSFISLLCAIVAGSREEKIWRQCGFITLVIFVMSLLLTIISYFLADLTLKRIM